MENLTLSIDTTNAAFEDTGVESEVARILKALAERIEREGAKAGQEFVLRDLNGNKVGTATVS